MDTIMGMIYYWPLSWAPPGYALCDGRTLPISQNQQLFSLIGTTYGGDGKVTFALPDLRGRVAIHQSQEQAYTLGQVGGSEGVQLTTQQMPSHTHALTQVAVSVNTSSSYALPQMQVNASVVATGSPGSSITPGAQSVPAQTPDYSSEGITYNLYGPPDGTTEMSARITIDTAPAVTVSPQPVVQSTLGNPSVAGNNALHNNMMPFLAVNFIIALQGFYPQRKS